MAKKPGAWHMGEALREVIGDGVAPTQAAATQLGVSYQTVYRWYAKPTLPPRIIENASAVLGCTEQWLMAGEGDKYPTARGVPKGERKAERLLLAYQAEVTRLSTRLMKEIVAALAEK